MRVNRFVLAVAFCAGFALLAGRAHAGTSSTLVEGFYAITDDGNEPNNPNHCEVGSDFGFFETDGQVSGTGTGQTIIVTYDAPQPTSVSHNSKKIAVKQNQFSTLQIQGVGGAAFNTGTIVVDKCSVNGSVNATKLSGSVTTSCKGDDLFAVLTADQAASVQQAFSGSKRIKFKYNASNGKASISIKCKGTAVLEVL